MGIKWVLRYGRLGVGNVVAHSSLVVELAVTQRGYCSLDAYGSRLSWLRQKVVQRHYQIRYVDQCNYKWTILMTLMNHDYRAQYRFDWGVGEWWDVDVVVDCKRTLSLGGLWVGSSSVAERRDQTTNPCWSIRETLLSRLVLAESLQHMIPTSGFVLFHQASPTHRYGSMGQLQASFRSSSKTRLGH